MSSLFRIIILPIIGLLILLPNAASAIPFGGVEFPLGAVSFADSVVSFTPGTNTTNTDASKALGPPDTPSTSNAVSLGFEGVLVVEFTDNFLVDQNTVEGGLDLFIFEVGTLTENFKVEISKDNITYITVADDILGQPTGVDIAPFVLPGEKFSFVRLTDLPPMTTSGTTTLAGADIDAIGAIGAEAKSIPEPITLALMGLGVAGIGYRRHLIKKAA